MKSGAWAASADGLQTRICATSRSWAALVLRGQGRREEEPAGSQRRGDQGDAQAWALRGDQRKVQDFTQLQFELCVSSFLVPRIWACLEMGPLRMRLFEMWSHWSRLSLNPIRQASSYGEENAVLRCSYIRGRWHVMTGVRVSLRQLQGRNTEDWQPPWQVKKTQGDICQESPNAVKLPFSAFKALRLFFCFVEPRKGTS